VVLNRSILLRLVLPTLPNLVHQVTWVLAMNWVYPALASLLNKSSVLFSAVLAYLFYPEERWLSRSGRFRVGLSFCVAGTLGLSLLRPDLDKMEVNNAILLVLTAAISWAIYSVSVKPLVNEVGSMVSFGVISIYMTIALFFIALRWGHLGHWLEVPWTVNLWLVISGVLCIGIAHTAYCYALRALSVTVCATMLLTTPLVTLLMSRWLFGEHLTGWQFVSGTSLILGGALTLLARKTPDRL
jgi:drug/metabolite transporter (DMT)-like permease